MRSEAQEQTRDEPPPGRPELEAMAAKVLSERLAVIEEIRDALQSVGTAVRDPQLAALLDARLREVLVALFDSGIHDEELRAEMARFTALNSGTEHILAALQDHERALQETPKAAAPGPRHRRSSRWANIPGQKALFVVKGLAVAALLPLGKRLAGHKAVTGAVTTAATAGLAVAVTLGPSSLLPFNGHPPGAQAATPGWHTSAEPLPSSSLIARNVTHPKGKHSAKGKGLVTSGVYLPPPPAPQPPSSPSSSSPSVQASVQAGTLSLSMTSADLSTSPQVQVEIDASGAPVDWKAWCNSSDVLLDGAATETGTAAPGQPSYVTLSLAQSIDALLGTTCHVWPGDLKIGVTIQVPVPVVVPSVVPSILPSVIPSGL